MNKSIFLATSGKSTTENSEQLPMGTYALRTSEHWLQNCSSVCFFFLFSEQGLDDKDSSVLYLNHLKPVMVLGMQNVPWVLTLAKHDTCHVTHQPSPVTHSAPVNPLTQVRYQCSICVLRCQVTQSTGI